MNPPAATTEPLPPPQQQQQQAAAQPHRFGCHRHPDESFTTFCPECLCERLAGLDQSSSAAAPRKSTSSSAAAAALRAIFRGSSSGTTGGGETKASNRNSTSAKPSSSFFAELRRTKSFSSTKGEGFSAVFEPQRKSCDVRVRNNLWSLLFSQNDERRISKKETRFGEAKVLETGKLEPSSLGGPMFEIEIENENQEEEVEQKEEGEDDEIRVSEETPHAGGPPVFEDCIEEIIEEVEEEEGLKPMKDHIDLDLQSKKPPERRDFKEIAGSFWSAASVFSKKLQKWRRKQKLKKLRNGSASAAMPVDKRFGRPYRETQSEIADYAFGRRSCDTDPRFSLDAGRISLDPGRISSDDPRFSFDEPRASWDGYLIGRTFPRLPPMLSVLEDAPVHVSRTDNQIPVEAPVNCNNEDEIIPGGSAQTREYYDSSSRRRKSLDRSSSIRKMAAAVVSEIDEVKSVPITKVSPGTADYLPGSNVLGADKEWRDSKSNSLRVDCSESFEMGCRDAASAIGNGDPKAASNKPRKWKAWSIWGLIHRRNGGNDDDEDRFNKLGGVEQSFSETWQQYRKEGGNGEMKGAFNRRVSRSHSSVSSRNLYNIGGGGSFGSARKSNVVEVANGQNMKGRDDYFLEQSRSGRYSYCPNNIENGPPRFYSASLRGSMRSGLDQNQPYNSHSLASSVLRLY